MEIGEEVIVVSQKGFSEPNIGLIGIIEDFDSVGPLVRFKIEEFPSGHSGNNNKGGCWWMYFSAVAPYSRVDDLIDLYYEKRKNKP